MFGSKQANLLFEIGSPSGFGVLAEQSDLDPTTIVRELVQNSLDAAREAGQEQAIIRFEIAEHDIDDIPAIDRYKEVFEKAKKSSKKQYDGTLPDTAQSIVNAMEEKIKASKIETLFVTDNGIGLNEGRMAALLAEGISYKSRDGAGSFGYGHTTVIPASDLRYILYGGFFNGTKIAAGHAVLAAFEEDNEIKGKDGYFVIKKTGQIDNPFKYPNNKDIPIIIKNKLDSIEKEWGDSGSVVVIPGFNYFKEDHLHLWSYVKKAAACNFFVAIAQGKLRIEFRDKIRNELLKSLGDSDARTSSSLFSLNKNSINQVLSEFKDEKRAKFLSGYKANKAYEAANLGKTHEIKTVLGTVKIKLYALSAGGITQVDLCRNGMHITGRVPKLMQADFEDYAPFHCLILTDASDDGEFHRLIRKSEPPKHNEIALNRLEREERKKVQQAFEDIKTFIKEYITKLDTNEFGIDDVLNLKSLGIDAIEVLPPRTRTGGNSRAGDGIGGGGGNAGGGGSDGSFKKSGRSVLFRATAVQTGKRSYDVQIALEESKNDNEIRFSLDEGLDLTCSDSAAEDFVYLKNIKVNGEKIAKEKLIKNEIGKVLGISLGSGKDDKNINLAFDFDIPDAVSIEKNATVSLKAEMVSRKMEKVE